VLHSVLESVFSINTGVRSLAEATEKPGSLMVKRVRHQVFLRALSGQGIFNLIRAQRRLTPSAGDVAPTLGGHSA
jgi:hypothetical protein